MSTPASVLLSEEQLDTLRGHGEEQTADAGEVLFDVGDEGYPLIVILDGEAAIEDPAGREIVRHGRAGFLGELSLLSGQTVFLRAVARKPLTYLTIEREVLRELLSDDPGLSDLILPTLIRRRELLQSQTGIGIEVVGNRSQPETRSVIEFAKRLRLPYSQVEPADGAGAPDPASLPLVRLPGGTELERPSNGVLSRALGIGLELETHETVDLLVVGGGPAGLGSAVYGASEGLATLVIEGAGLGGQAGASRRIENYLGFPGGISGSELTGRAVTQARKFGARMATPYRAERLRPGAGEAGAHVVELEGDGRVEAGVVVIATGAEYRRLPVDGLAAYEGISVFYAVGPPEAQLCAGSRVGVVGGGNSAAQAAIWLSRGGALTTLLHRRSDLSETMSDYLIRDLDRFGVEIRDSSEVAALHGSDGQLEAVTMLNGARLELSYLFLFLGAEPCTDWLGSELARDERGFIRTGADVGAEGLLESSIPGVFAAGDVRAGSIKRCATAVGEGATAVQLVHQYLAARNAIPTAARRRSGSAPVPPV